MKKDKMNGVVREELHLWDKINDEQPSFDLDTIADEMAGSYPDYVKFSQYILRNNEVLRPITNDITVKELDLMSHYLASKFIDDNLKIIGKSIPDDFKHEEHEEEAFNDYVNKMVNYYNPVNKRITETENTINTCINLTKTLNDYVAKVYDNDILLKGFIDYFVDGIDYQVLTGVEQFEDSLKGTEVYQRLRENGYII